VADQFRKQKMLRLAQAARSDAFFHQLVSCPGKSVPANRVGSLHFFAEEPAMTIVTGPSFVRSSHIRTICRPVLLLFAVFGPHSTATAQKFTGGNAFAPNTASPRLDFAIDPATPTRSLVPVRPKEGSYHGPLRTDDLGKVPELCLEMRPSITANPEERIRVIESIALTRSRIDFLNQQKTDSFIAAVQKHRRDLSGLPFLMADECRLANEKNEAFRQAFRTVAAHLGMENFPEQFAEAGQHPATIAERIWREFKEDIEAQDREAAKTGMRDPHVIPARIAALMQILGPQPEETRVMLVQYLAGVLHPESTKALAKLAVFSAEESVRRLALETLQTRRERDYTDILLRGLRYPYPVVAKRAAAAIIKLQRTDLVPLLLDILEEGDPREPRLQAGGKNQTQVVRELVRVNHLQNCFLCHPPAQPNDVSLAAVPIPGDPLDFSGGAYSQNEPSAIFVRFDMTYLRQDFSLLQSVADSGSWPQRQRFDFLVRTRAVTEAEAERCRDALALKGPGAVTPYQRAILSALRELTGRDTSPTASAWRDLLAHKD
jgi:HEAT repeat protein